MIGWLGLTYSRVGNEKIFRIVILQCIAMEALSNIERIKLHSFDNLIDKIKIEGKDTLIVFDIG